jgi:hypothetical protein
MSESDGNPRRRCDNFFPLLFLFRQPLLLFAGVGAFSFSGAVRDLLGCDSAETGALAIIRSGCVDIGMSVEISVEMLNRTPTKIVDGSV